MLSHQVHKTRRYLNLTPYNNLIRQAQRQLWISILLTFTAFGVQADDSRALSDAELEAFVAEIKATSEAASKELEDSASNRFDVEILLEDSDFDPQLVFGWISSETRWVPYHGVLRGAKGVLADRQGNSLDRSLLLASALNYTGLRTRLAHTQLPDNVAAELVSRQSAQPPPHGVQYALTDAGQKVVEQTERQTQDLLKVVGLSLPVDKQIAIDMAKDHWWIQVKEGDEWQDFDPLFSDLLRDQRPQPVETFATDKLPEGIPDELFHAVAVKVVIERFEEGEYVEEVPLELKIRTADSIAQSISLHFEPYGAEPPGDGPAWLMEANTLADTAQDWLPVFKLNGERLTDMGFGNDGHLEKNPAKPTINRKMDTAVSALGGLGADSNKQPVEPVLSAGWIEYELTKPKSSAKKVRRQIFSLKTFGDSKNRDMAAMNANAKAVRERGLSLLGSHQILVTNGDLPMAMFDRSLLEFWGKTGNLIAGVARVSTNPDVEEPNQRLASGTVFPMDLLSLAVMREALSTDAGFTYLGQANIFGNHYLYNEKQNFPEHAWDIVFNQVDVFPQNSDVSTINLRQGVLDTILESTLLPESSESLQHNTARLFDRQDETGPWRLWKPSDANHTEFSEEAIANMTAAYEANRIVVAPPRLPERMKAVWWEIDVNSYQALGIGPFGWGVELTERGVIQVPAQVQAAYTRTQGQAVCTGVAVATTAASLMLPEVRGTAIRTLPSIIAQSKPLLRRHCLVQGSWTPP